MRPLLLIALVTGLAILVSACTSSPSPPASPRAAPTSVLPTPSPVPVTAKEARVKIASLDADPCQSWDPCVIRIKAGTKVVWTNNDALGHDVTFVEGPEKPASGGPGQMKSGDSWSYTFTKPGIYEYQCLIHRPLMHRSGVAPRIIVE